MKQFIQDPIVSLKIDGVVSELHPELTEDQIREVSHLFFLGRGKKKHNLGAGMTF